MCSILMLLTFSYLNTFYKNALLSLREYIYVWSTFVWHTLSMDVYFQMAWIVLIAT